MKTLEDLTPEIQAKIPEYIEKYQEGIFDGKRYKNFNFKDAQELIDWNYKFCKENLPVLFVCDNPLESQILHGVIKDSPDLIALIDIICNLKNGKIDNSEFLNKASKINIKTSNNIFKSILKNIELNLPVGLYSKLTFNLTVVDDVKRSEYINDYLFTCNVWTNGWLAWYKFIQDEFKIEHEYKKTLDEFCEISMKANVYSGIFFETFGIVSKYPKQINRTNNLLHSESGRSIIWGYEFADFECYNFKGTNVPEKWIMRKEELVKDDILQESNAEKRRCLMEILGAKRYYDVLSDGKGLTILDEDIDHQGNKMVLYETTSNDEIIDSKVQFLECVDPSTGRVYNIYPPSQKCKNVWEAKANTFNDEQLFVRQGDVGLVNLNDKVSKPILET